MSKPTFSEETRKAIFIRDNKQCVNCGEDNKFKLSFHHLIHNTIVNRKIYGDERIQSEENGVTACQQCHANYTTWDRALVAALKEKWKEFSKSKLEPLCQF